MARTMATYQVGEMLISPPTNEGFVAPKMLAMNAPNKQAARQPIIMPAKFAQTSPEPPCSRRTYRE